jgi:hypothetical protein
VPDAAAGRYDLVLVSVRADQLVPACARLTGMAGAPAVLFFGNNPGGRSAIPSGIPGEVKLGFPGVGGVIRGGVAEYVRIRQQPTALQAGSDPRLAEIEEALRQRGFRLRRVTDMDGWLAYHAAFVACVCAALYRCGTDATRLAADRSTLNLMCAAVTEAFTALRKSGTTGLPRNLAVLHSPALRPVAVRYWAQTMRSPAGELCFAAHARHSQSVGCSRCCGWHSGLVGPGAEHTSVDIQAAETLVVVVTGTGPGQRSADGSGPDFSPLRDEASLVGTAIEIGTVPGDTRLAWSLPVRSGTGRIG